MRKNFSFVCFALQKLYNMWGITARRCPLKEISFCNHKESSSSFSFCAVYKHMPRKIKKKQTWSAL